MADLKTYVALIFWRSWWSSRFNLYFLFFFFLFFHLLSDLFFFYFFFVTGEQYKFRFFLLNPSFFSFPFFFKFIQDADVFYPLTQDSELQELSDFLRQYFKLMTITNGWRQTGRSLTIFLKHMKPQLDMLSLGHLSPSIAISGHLRNCYWVYRQNYLIIWGYR